MHIAICDDNVADRKQLERLLMREADKRASSGETLYTDSYGNPQALLQNPMQYDAFFIDICQTEGVTGMDVVNSLTDLGSQSPIILCCSEMDYRKYSLPKRVLFLNKPISVAALCSVLDEARNIKDSSAPLIELREDKGTYYVTEPEILYAKEDGRFLFITLADGRIVRSGLTAMNFLTQLQNFPLFFAPTLRSVVNIRHIADFHFTRVTMTDGTTFTVLGPVLFYAKRVWKELRSSAPKS